MLAPISKITRSSIGAYTRVRTLSAINDTDIGKFCSISRNVRIGLGRHPMHLLSTNSVFYSDQKNEIRSDWKRKIDFDEHVKTKIGNDVWIGEYVTIPGGITIGDGAVIGTNSIVTKDVPAYSIVAGCPARVVGKRFDDEIIELLNEIKWWSLKDSEISGNLEYFTTEVHVEKLKEFKLKL
ncbi:MAG: acetyltransferase-like isoleucine patch superfamily enzyme [Bermanella sp.]|jgi:acetyltransferase-like isoleucine patch superfamily enzyme